MSCMLHSNFNFVYKRCSKIFHEAKCLEKRKGRKGSKYSACNCRVIEQTLELFGHPVVHNIDGLNIMFFTVYTSKKFRTHTQRYSNFNPVIFYMAKNKNGRLNYHLSISSYPLFYL